MLRSIRSILIAIFTSYYLLIKQSEQDAMTTSIIRGNHTVCAVHSLTASEIKKRKKKDDSVVAMQAIGKCTF